MNKIDYAIMEVHHLDNDVKKDNILNKIHPLAKLTVTIFYLMMLTSISKYKTDTCIYMCIWLVIYQIVGGISMKSCFKRLKVIFTLVLIISIANPIMDRTVVTHIGRLTITSGMISMTTLILKGCFAIIAAYFFIITTGIMNFCVALKMLHVPNIMITVIMLVYRYIIVFLKETRRIWTAYSMRAPNHRGVVFKAWGSMVGGLVLRSIDKAGTVYDSMELRGFQPELFFDRKIRFCRRDFIYLFLALGIIFVIRYINIFEAIGNMIIY